MYYICIELLEAMYILAIRICMHTHTCLHTHACTETHTYVHIIIHTYVTCTLVQYTHTHI